MPFFIGLTLFFTLIAIANITTAMDNPQYNTLFDWFLIAFNFPLVLLGGMLFIIPEQYLRLSGEQGTAILHPNSAGVVLVFMGVWGMAAGWKPIRQALSRVLPLRPESAIQALALVFCGYLVGNTLYTLSGGLEELAQLTEEVSIFAVLLQNLGFALLAFLGVGLFIRRGNEAVQERLGLQRLTWAQVGEGLGWVVVLVLLEIGVTAVWVWLNPSQLELVESLNGQLLGGINSLGQWFTLALATGLGEELLFRGALQPAFGLGFTAVLFAVAHIQYGFSPATVLILLIGLILGWLRQKHHTTMTIFIHFGYNFSLGLLALLSTYAANYQP